MTRQLGIEARPRGVNLVDVRAGRAAAVAALICDVAPSVDALVAVTNGRRTTPCDGLDEPP
jgi:hypothetical protein